MSSRIELGKEGQWTYVTKKGFLFVDPSPDLSTDKTGNFLNYDFKVNKSM